MAFYRNILLATTVIAGASFALPTLAQTQQQTQQQAQQAQQEQEEGEEADATEVEEVVVTGSRIRRTEFTSPSPIQVITAESATLEGLVDTAEILQQSSVAAGSFQTNNQLTGFVTTGGPGVQTLSLRGLGANRTLVLLNGRRAGPAGVRGQVGAFDLNVIPSSIVQRQEILNDGASSIYGSDAIAGVVNIITKTNLDGAELNVTGSLPFQEGGEQYRVSGAWGKTFDRGYINIAGEFFRQEPLRRGDRDDTACAADYLFSTSGQRVDFSNLEGGTKCYNLGNNYVSVLRGSDGASFGNFMFLPTGVTAPTAAQGNSQSFGVLNPALVRMARNGFPATFPYADFETPLYDRATVLSPVDRATLYVSGGFDLTSDVEAYGEVLYSRRESSQDGVRQIFPQLLASNPNARQPDGTTFGGANRVQPVIAITSDSEQEVDYARVVGGLRGTFGDGFGLFAGWDWDVYGQWSKSDGTYTDEIVYNDRMAAVGDTRNFSYADALLTPQANATCVNNPSTGNVSNPGNISGFNCASLPGGIPWTSARVLAGNFTDAERAFLFGRETGTTTYEHKYVEGSITGELFDLPAGPIGVAAGFQFRQEEIDDTPGQASRTLNRWGQTTADRTAGSDEVKEAFAEFEIPLLRGAPLAERLTLNVSGRYSDYESYGESKTYKLGLNWAITPEWRIRASQGTSFRAPALYEQFLGNQTGFLAQGSIDACIQYEDSNDPTLIANCSSLGIPTDFTGAGSSALIITGGGRDVLEAETAEARTIGLIWTPEFFDFNVALDYFEIEVDDEIRQFGAANIVRQCYESSDFPTNPFCTLFNRDPATFQITQVNNSYVNVAKQVNRGIDLSVRYDHEFSFGDLTIDGRATWQLEDVTTLLGGAAPEDSNGETTEPDFNGSVSTFLRRDDWTYVWSVDAIGKQSDTEDFGGDVFGSARYGQSVYYKQYNELTIYHAFSVRKEMDDWTFIAGIRNAFDERPPSQSAGQFRIGTAAINLYDVVGRRAFFNVTKRF